MNIPFSPGDHVFAYLRDSGHEAQELSVPQQENAFRRWATENGLIVSFVYKDEARKGSSLVGRNALQAMMHEFRRGTTAKGVVVWRYNRFARSVDNAQFFRAEIRTLGYIFYSLNDKVPEGPMGRLFEAAIDFKDEQYLEELSQDVKRGLHDLILIHKCVPGTPPVGFRREPHQIGTRRDGSPHMASRHVQVPELKPRVLRAFQMRAERISIGQIHKQTKLLNAINSYRTFFSNPIYKGTLLYGVINIENFYEPMLPLELWNKVQAVQNNYTHRRHTSSSGIDHPRRANSRFLLSGISRHAKCGSPLYGHASKQRNKSEVLSYVCTRSARRRDCDRRRIPKELLEQAVVSALNDILTPTYLDHVFVKLQESRSSRLKKQSEDRKVITSELTKIHRQIKNVTDSLADMGASKSLTERLLDLETQETDLLSQLANLDATAEAPAPQIPPQVVKALAKNFKQIYDKADLDLRRMILRSLVDHVDAEREDRLIRGIIWFYYPPELPPPKDFPPGESNTVPTLPPTPGAH